MPSSSTVSSFTYKGSAVCRAFFIDFCTFVVLKTIAVHNKLFISSLFLIATISLASCNRDNGIPGGVAGMGYGMTVDLDFVTASSEGVTVVEGVPTLRLHNGQVVCGSLIRTDDAHKVMVTIEDGATVTLDGVTIDGKAWNDRSTPWAGITCEGDASIILSKGSENAVTNFDTDYPAIFVPSGKTLTIGGKGSLTARNTSHDDVGSGAGIGGGYELSCGNIVITGGSITANGGSTSAAIGGGHGVSCGSIAISGGTVTATGGEGAAGIGSGYYGGDDASCGSITITGGFVTATGGKNGAGIGSGANSRGSNECGDITISGACTVIATGGDYGAGIGTGQQGKCVSIIISGGTVTATGGEGAAGIGCGGILKNGKTECGSITIERSNDFIRVTAIKGHEAYYPIGYSSNDDHWIICGTITFGGHTVYKEGNPPEKNITDGGYFTFRETTTDLGDPEINYTNNTWVLMK